MGESLTGEKERDESDFSVWLNNHHHLERHKRPTAHTHL